MAQGNAGKGRPKGSKNKLSAALKDMIAQALEAAHPDGAVAYLTQQATANPCAFLALLGRVLRIKVTGANDVPLAIRVVSFDRLAKARERSATRLRDGTDPASAATRPGSRDTQNVGTS